MNTDPASLKNLQDIVLPDPVPLWPPGTGGLLILAVLFLCVAVIGLQYYLRKRASRYRRAGIALLGDAVTVQDVSIVLKRVSLAAFPREQVASLYGAAWVDFLNATCSRTTFKQQFFDNPAASPPADMLHSAQIWIACHSSAAAEKDRH